ncbi:hypothetical protein PN498_28265 [Oscillatoria sp. CS-180]|uniref:hypothetical protein n=1 Tax=Oscillatoria sp. CS-180 TaxID=3021720 RepID=UPI00232BEC58|nr:hypothetical protein [Oscillatoria sp. CS-180]MDB9529914.1 hypothetical protein [Oscillatoria sp. CS-180]
MIVREPLELAYLREQEQHITLQDTRAEYEEEQIAEGVAQAQILEIIHRHGYEFVERAITEFKQSQQPTCDQCVHWRDRCQGYCHLRASAELEPLPKSHAAQCSYFEDIGF